MTPARTHRIFRTCERQGVPPLRARPPGQRPCLGNHRHQTQTAEGLTTTDRTLNRALAEVRAAFERGVARLKSWRIFRRSRCNPNRVTSIATAILTLEHRR
ncbi:transposase family protein [Streptomyces kronopolitis]|uniref:transposase family protein n=1 Tax=Streptomyces kronopolitis TaxID=1612435 RepID=UPI0036CFCA4F